MALQIPLTTLWYEGDGAANPPPKFRLILMKGLDPGKVMSQYGEPGKIVHATPDAVWKVLDSIGGEHGWYSFPLAWWARGALDRAVGGVGLRRERRNPDRLAVGDVVDFWRVEERIPDQLLRLRAEMRLPGLAWLEFSLQPTDGATRLRQRALFHPRGLAGHAYWKGVAPFHGIVFGSMIRSASRVQ